MLTTKQQATLDALKEALDAPIVERQEEAYEGEDYYAVVQCAEEVMAAFGIVLATLPEEEEVEEA